IRIDITQPPSGGAGQYVVWLYDGAPRASEASPIRFQSGDGVVHDLGLGCRALPCNNLVSPGSVSCPATFAAGRTSRSLGAASAAALCVAARSASPRAPASLSQRFPVGTFTACGLISDPGSSSTKPVSIMNWVIVEAK